jgi:serine/threonine-protein kinase
VGALFIVTMSVAQGVRVAMKPRPFAPRYAFAPSDVTLANVAWPKAPELAVVETPPKEVVKPDEPLIKPNVTPTTTPVKPVSKPGPDLVEISAIVRPWGYVQVDEGARTSEALARHVLKVSPGAHRFTVTCDLCESKGRSVTVDVKGGEVVPLIAPLTPSLVSFEGWPAEARVRVGNQELTVKQSQETPFRIGTPSSGSPEMRHKIEYSVSQGSLQLERGVKYAVPGNALVVVKGAP